MNEPQTAADASQAKSESVGCCSHPRVLVYRTVRHERWTIRYRRCHHCGATTKTVQAGFVDGRQWASY